MSGGARLGVATYSAWRYLYRKSGGGEMAPPGAYARLTP